MKSDPIKYWKDEVSYSNRVNNNQNKILRLCKDYVKNNTILTQKDKTILFTGIKNLSKVNATIHDTDKAIFNKQVENSIILTELRKKLNKN